MYFIRNQLSKIKSNIMISVSAYIHYIHVSKFWCPLHYAVYCESRMFLDH